MPEEKSVRSSAVKPVTYLSTLHNFTDPTKDTLVRSELLFDIPHVSDANKMHTRRFAVHHFLSQWIPLVILSEKEVFNAPKVFAAIVRSSANLPWLLIGTINRRGAA